MPCGGYLEISLFSIKKCEEFELRLDGKAVSCPEHGVFDAGQRGRVRFHRGNLDGS
jgi:hypothetical protein